LEQYSSISPLPEGERIKVRGKIMTISTLTPALSRQRERGYMIFFLPLAGF